MSLRQSIKILLFAYCLIVFCFTVLGRTVQGEAICNLVPLSSWRLLLSVPFHGHGEYILKQIIVNMLMVVPIGLLFGLSQSSMLSKCLLFGLLFSISIELLQYCTRTGLCETDDVIHNTLGCLVGFGIGRLILRFTKKKIKPEQSV